MADIGKDTRIVPILGRQVVVRQLNDAQIMLLNREAHRIQRGTQEGREAAASASRIQELIEQTIVQPEDRDWVDDQIVAGKLEMKDLMGNLTAFADAAPTTGPTVRRGRPVRK